MSSLIEEIDVLETVVEDVRESVRILENMVRQALNIPVDPTADRVRNLQSDLAGLVDSMCALAKRVAK